MGNGMDDDHGFGPPPEMSFSSSIEEPADKVAGKTRVIPIVQVGYSDGVLTVESMRPVGEQENPRFLHTGSKEEIPVTRHSDTTFSGRISGWSGYVFITG